jgi:signal transduction histidine kinase
MVEANYVYLIGHMSKFVDVQGAGWYPFTVGSVTVYLVDDDRLAIKRLADALKSHTGYQVATFHTAEDAIAAADKRAPDVLIANYKLSDLDGLALVDRVGGIGRGVVGIVMATYGDEASMRTLLDAVGPLRVVNKPCDMRDLELKIRAGLERLELQAELRESRKSVRAARGEAATATERLVEAEQLAAVGRVVRGIAHEIGNQLALVGYAEAIKSRVADDPELSEFADVIVTAQKRLASMVDEIRDFASAGQDPGAGRALAREPSDLAGVVDEALSIMRYDRDVRDRKIERDYRDRPLAAVERQKFAQVIINLVSNAALATSAGDVITVRVETNNDAGTAVVTVADRGCGMPEDVLARLGEPFFSARADRGSGLGVGICRGIVERHGGALTFESEVGAGTRAIVAIPLLEDIA